MRAVAHARPRPLIDVAAGLDRMMGDRAMFLRVLGRFGADYRDLSARLHAALDAGDTLLAQRIAHTLKGAAGMIEANRLRALALEVELALKAGDGLSMAPIEELDDELAGVLEEVDGMLAAPTPPDTAHLAESVQATSQEVDALRALLDIGDGRAPELLQQIRPRLVAKLGSESVTALESAVRRFDFEHALALLAPVAE